MTTTRRERLESDYREIMSLTGPLLSVRPVSGKPPHVDGYELTLRIRSIIDDNPTYRSIHVVRIDLGAGYPKDAFPQAVMITKPVPYHPNWFRNGLWCHGGCSQCTEGLGNYVVRLMQTLQFCPDIIDVTSAANLEAATWYTRNKRVKGLFPCDSSTLPQPTVSGMTVHVKKPC